MSYPPRPRPLPVPRRRWVAVQLGIGALSASIVVAALLQELRPPGRFTFDDWSALGFVLGGGLSIGLALLAVDEWRGGSLEAAQRRLRSIALAALAVSGVAIIALLPPFQGPDEDAHFYFAIGRLRFFDRSDIEALQSHAPPMDVAFRPDRKIDTQALRGSPLAEEKTTTLPSYGGMLSYPAVVLASLLLAPARSLSTAWAFFYACRVVSLGLWLLALYWLSRRRALPMTLFAFVSLPLFVQQSVVVSSDAIVNLGALVAFATVLLAPRPLTWRPIALTAIAVFCATTGKPHMAILSVLVVWLVLERIGRPRVTWLTVAIGVLLLPAFYSLALSFLDLSGAHTLNGAADASQQVAFLRTGEGLDAFVAALRERWKHVGFLVLWAGPLGWMDTPIGSPQLVALEVLVTTAIVYDVAAAALGDGLRARLRTAAPRLMAYAAVAGALFMATFLLSCLAMYVGHTPVHARFVQGVQTRYLFPGLVGLAILPLAMPPAPRMIGTARAVAHPVVAIASGLWIAAMLYATSELTHTLIARYY
ncbi:MAG: DUF2142 domain-containing protein [Deltaproteobacteria bacterium]|nr:DUF2142 domain-containing protein [Deltaproteobacteria bacterium]